MLDNGITPCLNDDRFFPLCRHVLSFYIHGLMIHHHANIRHIRRITICLRRLCTHFILGTYNRRFHLARYGPCLFTDTCRP